MTLLPGSKVGPYEVIALVGKGGMGEVYRARDTRLNRVVALKVLLSQLSDHGPQHDRFRREALAISRLGHPHVCVLHDIGEHNGLEYLVMEFLEGETLAGRLSRGALPPDQVLRYAREIASALEKAHGVGITHRDVKPANIMLTKHGAKLLDFGLAKWRMETLLSGSQGATGPDTRTSPGSVVGTFNYMAPEQAEGKLESVDARSDVFSLGATLYEMVTGRKAFPGASVASVLSGILRDDPPPVRDLAPLTPPVLDRLICKCLAKNPDDRWQTAEALAEALGWIGVGVGGRNGKGKRHLPWRERLLWLVSTIGLIIAATIAERAVQREAATAPARVEFSVVQPQTSSPNQMELSPDGKRIAAFILKRNVARLWIYALESGESREVADASSCAFWAPDSRSIAYFTETGIERLDLAEGTTKPICAAPVDGGGAWNRDGVILFAPGPAGGIARVPATGGTPTAVTGLDTARQETSHLYPQFLPDGNHFIFLARKRNPGNNVTYVGSLMNGRLHKLADTPFRSRFSPPDDFLFLEGNTLMSQKMDMTRFTLKGTPVPVATDIGFNPETGMTAFTSSGPNVLVYRHGRYMRRLEWFNRTGKMVGEIGEPGRYQSVSLSPDGKQLAFTRTDQTTGNSDIWVSDLDRGTTQRVTSSPAVDDDPVWSPDGRDIAFDSGNGEISDLYRVRSTGAGAPKPLLAAGASRIVSDWSRDGRYIAFTEFSGTTGAGIRLLPMQGDHEPLPFAVSNFSGRDAHWAPDGGSIAYVSDESGRAEVYLQPFPQSDQKWQISVNGGERPRWRSDGRELYYLDPDFNLMEVGVQTGPPTRIGIPRILFQSQIYGGTRQYAPSRDGQRFLMVVDPEASIPPLTVILNWRAGMAK